MCNGNSENGDEPAGIALGKVEALVGWPMAKGRDGSGTAERRDQPGPYSRTIELLRYRMKINELLQDMKNRDLVLPEFQRE